MRRRLFIYPKFQMALMAANMIILIFCFTIFALGNHQAQQDLNYLGQSANFSPDHPFFNFLNMQAESFFFYFCVSFIVGSICSSFLMLYISHRLAGPFIRLQNFFNEIIQTGQVPSHPLKFREHDYGLDLADTINQALAKMNSKNEGQ